MFEKVNPYLKDELSNQVIAHLCGCRCYSGGGVMMDAISAGQSNNSCYPKCKPGDGGNKDANALEAYADKKW